MALWNKLFAKLKPKKVVQQLVGHDPTRGNRPGRHWATSAMIEDLPRFGLRRSQLMMFDAAVQFGHRVRNAALSSGELEIESNDPGVKQYIERQWDRLWNVYGWKIRRTRAWGFGGFQVLYRQAKDTKRIEIDGLKDFSPFDVRALSHNGEPCGFRLKMRRTIGGAPSRDASLFFPRALWTTFDAEWGNVYGRSINQRAYGPWWEKWMEHGAKEVTRLRMIKDASRGDIVWYPPNEKVQDADGNEVSWRDIMREVAENTLSGSALTLPTMYDREGHKLVDYLPPSDTGNPQGIWTWGDNLDRDILWAIGVPREIIEAASTGSGFSGRSIPLSIFLAEIDEEFLELVTAIDEQVLRPLVWLTYGEKADYEIKPRSLVETFAEDLSGSSMGGGAVGGQPGQQPIMPDVPRGAVSPQFAGRGGNGRGGVQFGEFDEQKHPRDESGEFTEKGTKRKSSRMTATEARAVKGKAFDVLTRMGLDVYATDSAKPIVQVKATDEARAAIGKYFPRALEREFDGQFYLTIGAKERPTLDELWAEASKPKQSSPEELAAAKVMDAWLEYAEAEDKAGRIPMKFKDWKVTQFAEGDTAGPHDELVRIGTARAHGLLADAAAAIRGAAQKKSADLTDPRLLREIDEILRGIRTGLRNILEETTIAADIAGAAEGLTLVSQVAASPEPPAASFLPPGGPPKAPPTLADLIPGREPILRFPVVDDAVAVLGASPVARGLNFHQTAERVREGAFAITADLTDDTMRQIRSVLAENIAQGPDRAKFVSDVQELFDGGMGLSRSRIDLVFHQNVAAQLSDGAERSLAHPMVVDAFPYREYYATSDMRVRPEHFALETNGLNGTAIYNKDDPAWQAFRPPWDWNCRCSWSPVTVERAARYGVVEAREWQQRAKDRVERFGGVPAEHLADTQPQQFQFVPWPTLDGQPFYPPPEFNRGVAFDEEFESKHPRADDGKFGDKGGGATAEKPKADKQTKTPEFRWWFGKSEVVDEGGEPLRVYHGTGHKFDTFAQGKSGRASTSDSKRGFWFTTNTKQAEEFTWHEGDKKGIIKPVYLKSERLLTIDVRGQQYNPRLNNEAITQALEQGYDGVRFLNQNDQWGNQGDNYIVFEPTQIKSASGNRGTFDPDDPRIQFAQFTEHAPAGGITIGGKRFEGGEFIPGEVMEGATEAERAAVTGKPEPATKSSVVATKRVGKELRLADGSPLPEHLGKLRVPPAWTSVMVDTSPEAALIVSGYDTKGRRQSVYSAAHSARQAGLKFSRIRELQAKIGGIRKQIAESDKPELSDALELILATGLRPGSTRDTKAAKQAFGATTLEGRHVVVTDTEVRLQFTGKKGVAIDVPVTDESVAAMLLIRKKASGDGGRLFNASDADLRKFTKTLDGGGFKPKDFRTLKGTSVAASLVRQGKPPADEKAYKKRVREVAKRVAAVLGNTPIIALQSYIDPTVFSAWRIAG